MGEAQLALQKSRGNHHSYVLKEAISGMVFVHAQKLFGRVWTYFNTTILYYRSFYCGDANSFIGPQDQDHDMSFVDACRSIFVDYKEKQYGTR